MNEGKGEREGASGTRYQLDYCSCLDSTWQTDKWEKVVRNDKKGRNGEKHWSSRHQRTQDLFLCRV